MGELVSLFGGLAQILVLVPIKQTGALSSLLWEMGQRRGFLFIKRETAA